MLATCLPARIAKEQRTDSLFILDKGKPVVRRGRKAMGPGQAKGVALGLPGCRRD